VKRVKQSTKNLSSELEKRIKLLRERSTNLLPSFFKTSNQNRRQFVVKDIFEISLLNKNSKQTDQLRYFLR
jgi:hypothetical protein